MTENLYLWVCHVNLFVFAPCGGSYWQSLYCSIPAKSKADLREFRSEWIKIWTVLDWHPIDYCPIAEIDIFEYPGLMPDTSGRPLIPDYLEVAV